jgi:hypothetical protein
LRPFFCSPCLQIQTCEGTLFALVDALLTFLDALLTFLDALLTFVDALP